MAFWDKYTNLQTDMENHCLRSGNMYEPVHEKTNNLGSDQVQHKPGCTVTEDGSRLEILDLESSGIALSV